MAKTSFDWQGYVTEMSILTKQLQNYHLEAEKIRSNADTSVELKEKQLAALEAGIRLRVADTFDGMTLSVESAVEDALKATIRKPIDAATRTYEATTAYQDIQQRSGDVEALLKLYTDSVEAGNLTRRDELKRLLEPLMRDVGSWYQVLEAGKTLAERQADYVKAAAERMQEAINQGRYFAEGFIADRRTRDEDYNVLTIAVTGAQRVFEQNNVEPAAA